MAGLLSLIVGIPASYELCSYLLSELYVYHMPVSIPFIVMGCLAVAILAVLTISGLLFKVIRTNPAEVLRDE